MLEFVLSLGIVLNGPAGDGQGVEVRVALNEASELDVVEVVARLASASGFVLQRPDGKLSLPLEGRAAGLTRGMLAETLGPDASLQVRSKELVITLAPKLFEPERLPDWEKRIRSLAARASKEIQRRSRYGMHARNSYRANDPNRPTLCLIHGLNSTSSVFLHMVEPLEEAGYGIVVYDFPYNRDLDNTSAAFARDWASFRKQAGETRPWSIVAHSMGSLLARAYVEDDAKYARDVVSLILIAPPNHGSSLSKAQTLLQTIQSLQALNGQKRTDPLAVLGDGLGLAADDMAPGSDYLKALNAHKPREGVLYHILAGDVGYLSLEARRQFENRPALRGVLGGFGRMVASGVSSQLDELTDSLGDGCVSVASTKLDGVEPPRVLHANHLELIRAPLLFPDPGPVVSMPDILRWLAEDATIEARRR